MAKSSLNWLWEGWSEISPRRCLLYQGWTGKSLVISRSCPEIGQSVGWCRVSQATILGWCFDYRYSKIIWRFSFSSYFEIISSEKKVPITVNKHKNSSGSYRQEGNKRFFCLLLPLRLVSESPWLTSCTVKPSCRWKVKPQKSLCSLVVGKRRLFLQNNAAWKY